MANQGNVNQILAKLDAASLNTARAADARRVLSTEANILRAVVQSGDSDRIGKALTEAERVLDMWAGY